METSKSFEARLARIYEVTQVKGDTALAKILNIKPPSVAAARKRRQIPTGWIECIAEKYNVSADWLFFGRGCKNAIKWGDISDSKAININYINLSKAIIVVEEGLSKKNRVLTPEKKADLIVAVYDFISKDNAIKLPYIAKFIDALV